MQKNRLRKRTVDVLKRDQDSVILKSGLSTGEYVIISPLEYIVEGMRVSPQMQGVSKARSQSATTTAETSSASIKELEDRS